MANFASYADAPVSTTSTPSTLLRAANNQMNEKICLMLFAHLPLIRYLFYVREYHFLAEALCRDNFGFGLPTFLGHLRLHFKGLAPVILANSVF